MPGFDIDLPSGRVTEDGADYRDGRFTMHDIGGAKCSLQLNWEPGSLLDADAIMVLNEQLGAVLAAEPRPISLATPIAIAGPEPNNSWAFRAGSATGMATQVVCGARRLLLRTLSKSGDVERLHRQIAASLRCRPDAAKERMIDDVPVVLGLGPGWFRMWRTEAQLMLTNRRWFVTARPLQRSARNPDLVKALSTAGGLPGIELRERVGDDWLIQMRTDGTRLTGWATLRDCPDNDRTLLFMSLADSDDVARKLLAGARCRKPNESPQAWPDLPLRTAE